MHLSQRRFSQDKADSKKTETAKFANGMITSSEGLSTKNIIQTQDVRVFNEGLHKPYFYMNKQTIIQTNAIHSNFCNLGSLGKFDYSFFENKEMQYYSGTIFTSVTESLNKVSVYKLPRIQKIFLKNKPIMIKNYIILILA